MLQTQSEIDDRRRQNRARKIPIISLVSFFCVTIVLMLVFAPQIRAKLLNAKENARILISKRDEMRSFGAELGAEIHKDIANFEKKLKEKANSLKKIENPENFAAPKAVDAKKNDNENLAFKANSANSAVSKPADESDKNLSAPAASLQKAEKSDFQGNDLAVPEAENFAVKTIPPPKEAVPPAAVTSNQAPKKAPPKKSAPKKIAIVLDDGGYDLDHLQMFLDLPIPLTIAVLPKTPFSADSAQAVRDSGKELILHQPMQPKDNFTNPGEGAISPFMSNEEIYETLEKNLAEIGSAAGMNNHEGSLSTEDEREMSVVLDFCRDNSMFFLDSKTSNSKTSRNLARAKGMKILERDIFLDNDNEYENIAYAFECGLKIAERKGSAIFIGHVKSAQLARLLREKAGEIKARNFAFVHLSELASQ